MSDETFGQYLKTRIDQLDTNARQVAIAMGIPAASISNWINDRRKPDPESCMKLSDVLGLSLDDLLERAGHRPRTELDRSSDRLDLHDVLDRLPASEIPFLRDFLNWRLREAGGISAKRPVRRPSKD